jgi:hypothetical protein
MTGFAGADGGLVWARRRTPATVNSCAAGAHSSGLGSAGPDSRGKGPYGSCSATTVSRDKGSVEVRCHVPSHGEGSRRTQGCDNEVLSTARAAAVRLTARRGAHYFLPR